MTEQTVPPRLIVYINSDRMGQGDDDLGQNLIATFLETATNFVGDISHILLVNSGVKLACTGSAALESMKMLANAGVTILACGTCLKHFQLMEKIEAGAPSNMFTILDLVSKSEKVLTP